MTNGRRGGWLRLHLCVMKTRLLSIVRSSKSTLGAYHYGQWRAGRIHCATDPRQVVRETIRALFATDNDQRFTNMARGRRNDRIALYAGTIAALRQHLGLMRAFRL